MNTAQLEQYRDLLASMSKTRTPARRYRVPQRDDIAVGLLDCV